MFFMISSLVLVSRVQSSVLYQEPEPENILLYKQNSEGGEEETTVRILTPTMMFTSKTELFVFVSKTNQT